MKLAYMCLTASFGLFTLLAQNPGPGGPRGDPKKVELAGDRFRPLKYAEMTPAQQTMIDNLFSGDRGGASGPFNVLLRSPELGDLVQKFGAQGRYHSDLPEAAKEMAILMVARHWTSQYEWYAHKRLALAAGLKPAQAEAIANHKHPAGLNAQEEAIYNFAHELLTTSKISDATYAAAIKTFDERRVVNLIGVMGYYTTVSMLLNTDRYPLPAGVQPELK